MGCLGKHLIVGCTVLLALRLEKLIVVEGEVGKLHRGLIIYKKAVIDWIFSCLRIEGFNRVILDIRGTLGALRWIRLFIG